MIFKTCPQIGINPGLYAAYKGHHYAGPGNHFWKCLHLAGLTPDPWSAEQDRKLLELGIGFTNMVQRPTKGSADLTRKEIKEGCRVLHEKLQRFRPRIAVFNGKLIFEVFSGKKEFNFGRQPDCVEGTNTVRYFGTYICIIRCKTLDSSLAVVLMENIGYLSTLLQQN